MALSPLHVPTIWRTLAHQWLRSVREFGAPQQISTSRLAFVTATTSLTGGQSNFARCLTVSFPGTLYEHFQGLLPPDGILPGAKFTLRPSLASSYIHSVTMRHSSSGHQPNFVAWYTVWNYGTFAPMFGWAAITLGIGPHFY